MIRKCGKGQGSLEYLLLIGGSVVVALIVIFIVIGLPQGAGNVAQTGLEQYREVVGVKVTGTIVASPPAYGSYGINETILFTAEPRQGTPPYNCEWDFGDGETASDLGCDGESHQYVDAGDYTVTVTITDSQNEQTTKHWTISIMPPTQAVITSPSEVNLARGTSITLSCAGSVIKDPLATCSWAVQTTAGAYPQTAEGDPENDVTITLNNIDFYSISLTVTDQYASATASSQFEAYFLETFDDASALNNLPNRHLVGSTIVPNWVVEGGQLKNTYTANYWDRAISNMEVSPPYAAKVKMKLTAGYGVLITDQGTPVIGYNSYINYLYSTVVFLYEWGGSGQIIKSPPGASLLNNWHTAKFVRTQNNTLKAYLNGTQVCGDNCLTSTASCATAPFETDVCEYVDASARTGKKFGVGRYTTVTTGLAYFDDLEIRKCTQADCSDR